MIVIIAGSRSLAGTPRLAVTVDEAVAASGFDVSEVMSGCARGVDLAGEAWANERRIPIIHWPYIGHLQNAGGIVRNRQMARFADALVVVHDSRSVGTLRMIEAMRALDKPVHVAILLRARR